MSSEIETVVDRLCEAEILLHSYDQTHWAD